jgi:hypothetical protein
VQHSTNSFVLQLVTIQAFCNLPLSCFATCRSVVVQLVTTQFCNLLPPSCSKFVTTQLFCNLSPLGCRATCHHSFVLQLFTTQPLCKLSLSFVQIVTQLFCKVFTCCALMSLVCNASLRCSAPCPLVVQFFTHTLCAIVTLEHLSHCLVG